MSHTESKPKKSIKSQMELLAPAGDWESLLAALAAGADSVYLGGKVFNARQYASNFDLPRLKAAVDLLHLRRKKIYVTVNTLISDGEMPEALRFLTELYNIGVDAVIVQDLGLMRLAREYLPELELHASTQMTVHNGAGALFLKRIGIKRVVLARELTQAEVQAIKAESGLELEVFLHGALCVCYSGQCLMSSMIGGRSGNRGRCAQPCRLEYQLFQGTKQVKTEGPFLLSPKDLALAPLIPELSAAGVDSLKIEGRMKSPEYVYTVVKIYRRLLDRYAEMPEKYLVEPDEIRELSEIFNRGFSTGYFGGNRNRRIIGFSRPNNRGLFLGRIKNVNHRNGLVGLRLETELAKGDLVEVWVSQGGRVAGAVDSMYDQAGTGIESAGAGDLVSFGVEGKVYPNDRVFKIASARLRNEVKAVLNPDNPIFKIPCRAIVEGRLGEPLRITFMDESGNQGTAETSIPLQKAKNRPLTAAVLWEQLGRLGNTFFRLTALENKLADDLMAPLSELNETRRRAVDALTAKRLAPYQHPRLHPDFDCFKPRNTGLIKKEPLLSVWVADLAGAAAAAESGADIIYAGGDELTGFHWERNALLKAYETARANGSKLVFGLPRIIREGQKSQWLPYLKTVFEIGGDGIIVSDLGGLELALSESDCPLYLNYTLNFFNRWSVELPLGRRLKQVSLSPELTLNQIKELLKNVDNRELNAECIVQGPIELMISEYCPIGAVFGNENEGCRNYCKQGRYYLKDRLNLDFPIFTDQFCRMHLLNSVDLCLYPDLDRLLELSITLRLELKTMNAEAAGFLVAAYKQKMSGGGKGMDSEKFIERLRKFTGRGITKGHYFRGVE